MQTHQNLTQNLRDTLGKAIVTGRYDQRSFPTEADITNAHGVSRSVTREALKMLTGKGLVSAKPRRGTIVEPFEKWNLCDSDVLLWLLERKFSIQLLRQFTQLRRAIEPEAAALAAQFHQSQDIQRLEEELEGIKLAEKGHKDPLTSDIGFHVAILDASKNPFFFQFRPLIATALKTSIRFTNKIKGHSAHSGEHEAVLKAIMAGDRVEARTTMVLLIDNVLDLINDHQ